MLNLFLALAIGFSSFASSKTLTIRNPGLRALSPAIDCYNRTGNLNEHDSAILCSGARDASAPIECYNRTGNLNVHDSAVLCSGATDPAAPIDCFAQTGNLNNADSAILCSGSKGAVLGQSSGI
ncbi:MAG: hypothetical protein AB7F86_09195 [Bdellovibrionales bacterium]